MSPTNYVRPTTYVRRTCSFGKRASVTFWIPSDHPALVDPPSSNRLMAAAELAVDENTGEILKNRYGRISPAVDVIAIAESMDPRRRP